MTPESVVLTAHPTVHAVHVPQHLQSVHAYLNVCMPHIPECSTPPVIVLDVLIFSGLSYCPGATIMGDWA